MAERVEIGQVRRAKNGAWSYRITGEVPQPPKYAVVTIWADGYEEDDTMELTAEQIAHDTVPHDKEAGERG